MRTTRLLILMRDQLGRFMRIRAATAAAAKRHRGAAGRTDSVKVVQLALF